MGEKGTNGHQLGVAHTTLLSAHESLANAHKGSAVYSTIIWANQSLCPLLANSASSRHLAQPETYVS